jgi:hypothetical protein
MAIIIDVKNAIRRALYQKDKANNFFFNKILIAEYPYIFFYIPSFKTDNPINLDTWSKITLMCVVEYAKAEDNTETELWEYADTLTQALSLFDFADTKIGASNIDFKLVESVLQMTFDLEVYVKKSDLNEYELMQEIDITTNIGDFDKW